MPWVNEFLLRRKKGELGVSRRRLVIKRRGKINRLKEQKDLPFSKRDALYLPPPREERSRDEEGLSEVGARLCPSPQ